MNFVQPTLEQVFGMLGMLFGDGTEVTPTEAPDLSLGYVGNYVNPEGETVAACICDRAATAYFGAALSMLPPGGAADAAKGGEISETMEANLYEIMNILTRLVMDDETPHLKLEKVQKVDDDAAINAIRENAAGCHFHVVVPRYGSGTLSFLVT